VTEIRVDGKRIAYFGKRFPKTAQERIDEE